MAERESVTVLLSAWRAGDRAALERATPLVYDELRRVAAAYMRRERAGHTLSAADLVAEAFMRLTRGEQPEYESRVQFYAVAARHMRRILVDHARQRTADKRGGRDRPVTLDESAVSGERPEELCALDEALDALAKMDARKAQAIELHYFAGMTHAEIASALAVHENTVARDIRLGEAWLHRHLQDPT
jgi:RNA polymerase sigma factor (TIGR02999 family)